MRQSGRVPQAWTSHWPGLKPVMPRRTIFWYFPRATHSGGQGKVKVCPSGDGVEDGVAAGARTTLRIKRSNKEMETTPVALHNLEHAMIAPPCPRWQPWTTGARGPADDIPDVNIHWVLVRPSPLAARW